MLTGRRTVQRKKHFACEAWSFLLVQLLICGVSILVQLFIGVVNVFVLALLFLGFLGTFGSVYISYIVQLL